VVQLVVQYVFGKGNISGKFKQELELSFDTNYLRIISVQKNQKTNFHFNILLYLLLTPQHLQTTQQHLNYNHTKFRFSATPSTPPNLSPSSSTTQSTTPTNLTHQPICSYNNPNHLNATIFPLAPQLIHETAFSPKFKS
jgi:hypothetical protein